MKQLLISTLFILAFGSCRKLCPKYVYNVEAKITVTPPRKLLFGDTLVYKIEIPFNAPIINTTATFNIKGRKFTDVALGLSLTNKQTSNGIDSFTLMGDPIPRGYIKVINLQTGAVINNLHRIKLATTDSSFIVKLGIIPLINWNGVYYLRPYEFQSVERCDKVVIQYKYTNTNMNYDLANFGPNFSFYQNDYIFTLQ